MKGLKEYIRKHGIHFTEQLAMDVTRRKWNPSKVEKDAQKKVYYNVTGSTRGDMVYLMDMFYCFQYTEGKCINLMLKWVGDYNRTNSPFCIWLSTVSLDNREFDFTPYI